MANKVLIVSFYYTPEIGAAASRIANMAEGLQRQGLSVDVLTCLPNYPRGRIFEGYRGCYSKKETINDINIKPDESFAYCTEENMTFLADVNAAAYSLQWDFGDGFTSNDNPATHVYHDKIVYPVTLTVSADENSCSTTGTLTSNFIIDLTQQYITENDEVCMGDLYSEHGFNA